MWVAWQYLVGHWHLERFNGNAQQAAGDDGRRRRGRARNDVDTIHGQRLMSLMS